MVQFAAEALLGPAQLHEFPGWAWRAVTRRPIGRAKPVAPGRIEQCASYATRKPYVVAERLEELCGPTAGVVALPAHLDWSGNATYDLGRPARLVSLYRTVLNEAGGIDDLRAWLNARLLTQLWPTLWLPPALRRIWEDRFPELAMRRA